MATAECPFCASIVTIQNNPKIGKRVRCPECDEVSEVFQVDPIELDYIDEFEDDFVDFFDEN